MEQVDAFKSFCLSENDTIPLLNLEHKLNTWTITTINLNYSNHKMLRFTDEEIATWNGHLFLKRGFFINVIV